MTSIDDHLLFLLLRPLSTPPYPNMEDPNVLAGDCIVICCCCQCLILQILVFILVKLPYKLLRKTRSYAKKLRTRKKERKIIKVNLTRYDEDSFRYHGKSFRFDIQDFFVGESCLVEMDKVFEEFCDKGEFAFGSFWGGESSERSLCSCLRENEVDYDEVRYHLVELFGSVNLQRHSF